MAETGIDPALVDDLMRGAIDTHVHAAPDLVPRKMDDLGLARAAADAGMAGYVSKNHQAATAGQAALATQVTPGVRVYGSIALNAGVGGINPEAVRVALALGARIVWLPTISSEHHRQLAATSERAAGVGGGTRGDAVKVVDEQGRLVTALYDVFDMVKGANALLETGHISVAEIFAIAREARSRDVKVMVTHPESPLVGMSADEQLQLAGIGCYFEHCYGNTVGQWGVPTAEMAHNIYLVGVPSSVMATDFGQAHNPPPTEGLRSFIRAMLEAGFSAAQVKQMVQDNPRHLLEG
ncbi:MAG: DUF6282 family protein [Bacteroidetes bacterium]|nr:DUF6282 family protein [Bacteroidota bacterium]MCL5027085.1 DUF6282 family protein [Chloroflexota bacterium]